MNTRKLYSDECKCIYTLNTWSEDQINQAKEWLEDGYYVYFGSRAIGHTLSEMVEYQGIKLMRNIYGDRLEVIQNEGWGDMYCHLKQI